MPQLWAPTREAHWAAVDDAILSATVELVAERRSVAIPMSAVAARAGIGRPALYKHYPDVESILAEHHKRQVTAELEALEAQLASADASLDQLAALITSQRRRNRDRADTHLVVDLAHGDRNAATPAEKRIHDSLTRLLTQLAVSGEIRTDRTPAELARWTLHTVHAPELLDDDFVAELVVDSLRGPAG